MNAGVEGVLAVANRLTRKLGLKQTPGKDVMKAFVERARILQGQGHTADRAAITAANEKFQAEFEPTRYVYHGEPMETLLAQAPNASWTWSPRAPRRRPG
jgi:hypothetical protein